MGVACPTAAVKRESESREGVHAYICPDRSTQLAKSCIQVALLLGGKQHSPRGCRVKCPGDLLRGPGPGSPAGDSRGWGEVLRREGQDDTDVTPLASVKGCVCDEREGEREGENASLTSPPAHMHKDMHTHEMHTYTHSHRYTRAYTHACVCTIAHTFTHSPAHIDTNTSHFSSSWKV